MATDPNGCIGKDGALPWNYPEEFQHFLSTTKGHVMIMGRKSYLDNPPDHLKNTLPIVFTRDKANPVFHNTEHKVIAVSTIEELLQELSKLADRTIYFIGGSELAKVFFNENLLSEFTLTEIHQRYAGDCYLDLQPMRVWERQVLKTNNDFTVFRVVNPSPRTEYRLLNNA